MVLMAACRHGTDGGLTDELLFNDARRSGFTYYTGTPGITAPAGDSPHGDFRVRFNPVALTALDSTGRLPEGASFPAGSVIVKDVYTGGAIALYAVMKKEPSDPLAGAGWLWGEYGTDGSVVFSAGGKGDGCIGCHESGEHRDLVRVFDLH